MTIQLATYSYYNDKTKKRESLEFFLNGKEIDHEKYLECVDQFNMEYTQKTGDDNNGILRVKNINKIQPDNIQPIQPQQTCNIEHCPDCGEPYESEENLDEHESDSNQCHCADCESQCVIEDCLNFVFGTENATVDQIASAIFNMALEMREVGYQEKELEFQEQQNNSGSNDTYNITVNVSNNKNVSKTVGNIVSELKKNNKQNINVSEEVVDN